MGVRSDVSVLCTHSLVESNLIRLHQASLMFAVVVQKQFSALDNDNLAAICS